MEFEGPNQELVKCVVVGDTAVGKTRLICARACNARLTLHQLMNTHIPTVWAIDQYRIYKEVLERSWEIVDGVNVSLRLWDTFGDHDKDRRFAYGRSDVVLLCFSIANPVSLRNCKGVWYPEIRRFCPNTPIILVGCKNDLRYMYRDEEFLALCRDRSPFFRGNHPCVSSRVPEFGRPLRETDILTPEQGRLVGKEIGAPYYETSVLTHFGVGEVFENVIRAALLSRRQQRFWMTNLKHVQRPLLQVPFCPPKPPPPELTVPASQFEEDALMMWESGAYADVLFVSGGVALSAHRLILAAVSNGLNKLLTMDLFALDAPAHPGARSASDSSMMSTLEASIGNFNSDTEQLLAPETTSGGGGSGASSPSTRASSFRLTRGHSHSGTSSGIVNMAHHLNQNGPPLLARRRSTCQIHPEASVVAAAALLAGPFPLTRAASNAAATANSRSPGLFRTLANHAAFQSIGLERRDTLDHRGRRLTNETRTVFTLNKLVSPAALEVCLKFAYTASIDAKSNVSLAEVQGVAEMLDLPELQVYVSNLTRREEFLNVELRQKFLFKLRTRLSEICLDQGLFPEVLFQLDDGTCYAHRPILINRCDMMAGMFRGDFRESSAKVIRFPGVKKDCFRQLLVYLYTDELDFSVSAANCLELLELANRLCLPRLVALVEQRVVNELLELTELGEPATTEAMEHSVRLLEPSQLHNADQLADWCLYHVGIRYNEICHKNPKLLRSLQPENQAYLNRNRWPPIWYLKEFDFYERCLRERQWQEKPPKAWKRYRNNNSSGCLCFSGKSSHRNEKRAYRTV